MRQGSEEVRVCVQVCLVPQSFHNEVRPDCFDNSNYNFMFRLMPYYFGAGCCFVTGAPPALRTPLDCPHATSAAARPACACRHERHDPRARRLPRVPLRREPARQRHTEPA